MMQRLASAYIRGENIGRGPDRGLINEDDAVNALMQTFAVIDQQLQENEMPPDKALHAMQMLMVIHEFIRPIPGSPGDEELFNADLAETAALLRENSP